MSVNFYLSGHPGKEGEQQIRISANIKKTRFMSTIGISVKDSIWNKETQTVKLKAKNAKGESSNTINRLVDEYKLGVTKAGDTVFYQIDQNGEYRTGKVMKYAALQDTGLKTHPHPLPSLGYTPCLNSRGCSLRSGN